MEVGILVGVTSLCDGASVSEAVAAAAAAALHCLEAVQIDTERGPTSYRGTSFSLRSQDAPPLVRANGRVGTKGKTAPLQVCANVSACCFGLPFNEMAWRRPRALEISRRN